MAQVVRIGLLCVAVITTTLVCGVVVIVASSAIAQSMAGFTPPSS